MHPSVCRALRITDCAVSICQCQLRGIVFCLNRKLITLVEYSSGLSLSHDCLRMLVADTPENFIIDELYMLVD